MWDVNIIWTGSRNEFYEYLKSRHRKFTPEPYAVIYFRYLPSTCEYQFHPDPFSFSLFPFQGAYYCSPKNEGTCH